MQHRREEFNTYRLAVLVAFLLVAFLVYNLVKTIYQNYQIQVHLQSFQEKNALLKQENKQKLEDYKYFTSQAYIDKMAKQNLGLIQNGEKVIVIPDEDLIIKSEAEDFQELTETLIASWPNYKRWWYYLFIRNPFKS